MSRLLLAMSGSVNRSLSQSCDIVRKGVVSRGVRCLITSSSGMDSVEEDSRVAYSPSRRNLILPLGTAVSVGDKVRRNGREYNIESVYDDTVLPYVSCNMVDPRGGL